MKVSFSLRTSAEHFQCSSVQNELRFYLSVGFNSLLSVNSKLPFLAVMSGLDLVEHWQK